MKGDPSYFMLPKRFGRGTKEELRISKEVLFKGVSSRFGLLTIEKSVEKPDFIICSSFQNLRLGSIKTFARWVYKIQTHAMTRRRVVSSFGWMRLYLCKIFARWAYKKYQRTQSHAMHIR
jgi:hypothetical protein